MKWYIGNEQDRALDRKHFLDLQNWPRWPLLPLKRSGEGVPMECGTVLAGESPIRVYKATIFLLKRGLLKPQLDASGVYGEYATIEEMQADGWRID